MTLGRLPEGRALDAALVALALAGQLEIWVGHATESRLAAAVGALVATLPLLWRRRFPLQAPLVVFAGVAAVAVAAPGAVRDGASTTVFGLLVAFWAAGSNEERHQAVAVGAVGFAALAVLAERASSPEVQTDPLFPGGAVAIGVFNVYVVVFVVLAAGLFAAASTLQARARRTRVLEARAARLEGEREGEARAAVAAERRRIARDLHEAIVRGVTVMTVQAGAARLRLDEEPSRAREPLLSVEEAGRQTLAETRRLLGILRTEESEAAAAAPAREAEPGPAPRSWRLLRRHLFDALVVGTALASELELWVTSVRGPTLVLIPAVLLWNLPLLWRRRLPFAAPAFVFVVEAAASFTGDAVGGDVTSSIPLFLAFWALGAGNEPRHALAGALLGFASIVVIAGQDVRLDAGGAMSAIVILGALALAAYVLRQRSARAATLEHRAATLERARDEQARAAVAAERRRIARDLHDVIAHSVSVMTIQAGAARLLLAEDQGRARDPLVSVEETGRQTLAEMRRLLGFLEDDEAEPALAPRPGLAALESLLAQVRAAGLSVELAVEGEPRVLPPGVELAAYRIVQEALTNARKHGAAGEAGVALRYGREALELEITNDTRPVPGTDGGGHGLAGMRERVTLYGGELEAGARREGGYAVRARLPVESTQ